MKRIDAQHAERMSVCINKDNIEVFFGVLEARKDDYQIPKTNKYES